MYTHPEINYQPQHPLLNNFKHSDGAGPGSNIQNFELVKPPPPTEEEKEQQRRFEKAKAKRKQAKENLDLAQESVNRQEAHNLETFRKRRDMTLNEPKKCQIGINDWCPLGYNKKYLLE